MIDFNKILSFLRVRSVRGGLEVSDQVLRFVSLDGKKIRTAAVRLEPGVLSGGTIKDEAAFREALRLLRSNVGRSPNKERKINVAVALSSVNIYSQVFSLPIIEGRELDKAIELNVQMLSPMDLSETYASSQFLRRDEQALRLEFLAAFVDKKIVDDMTTVLFEEGFLAIALESRSLSLIRLIRERGSGIDPLKSYLLVNIDNSGMNFVVVRGGGLYFEYGTAWPDLMDDKGEITVEKFKETLTANLRQVFNFYEQHWPEPLAGVILSAAAFRDETEEAMQAILPLPITPLTLASSQVLSMEWLVAFGCSLRSAQFDRDEVNLIGKGARVVFREEQALHFTNFWRVVLPAALGLLLLTFGVADSFIIHTRTALEAQSEFQVGNGQVLTITDLEASATAFNQSVSLLAGIESSLQPKYKIMQDIADIAASSSVKIAHVSLQGSTAPVFLSGSASDENSIVQFRDSIQADPRFGMVNLPLTNIQPSGGVFTFSMSFPLSQNAFQ